MKSVDLFCLGVLFFGGAQPLFAEQTSEARGTTQWDCTARKTSDPDLFPCRFYQQADVYDQLPNVYITPKAPGIFEPLIFNEGETELNPSDPSQLRQKVIFTLNAVQGPVSILVTTESSPKTGRWGGSGYRHANRDAFFLASRTMERALDYWEAIRTNGSSEVPEILVVNQGLNAIEITDPVGKKSIVPPEDSSPPISLTDLHGENKIVVSGLKVPGGAARRVSDLTSTENNLND